MKLPKIGFGTWELEDGQEVEAAVGEALKNGYRLIDTARIYGNEVGVGRAVKRSGVARGEIIITTKLWPGDQGYESTYEAFEGSRQRLGEDYIDLYLIHWPGRHKTLRQESWEAMIELQKDGLLKDIGVSNYMVEHLEELIGYSETLPAVNQIEFHPYIYRRQKPVLDWCRDHGTTVEAYSPLARGQGLDEPELQEIAKSHGKTPGQVMLRWAIQHGTTPIPKSAHTSRIRENIEVFDFELTQKEMSQLDNLS